MDLLPTTLGPRTTFSFTGMAEVTFGFILPTAKYILTIAKEWKLQKHLRKTEPQKHQDGQIRSAENTRYCHYFQRAD